MDQSETEQTKKSSRKRRPQKVRRRKPRHHAWWERGHRSVAGITDGGRKVLFPLIAAATRTVVGQCFQHDLITKAQREKIVELVCRDIGEAKLDPIPLMFLRTKVDFWLKVYNPAKALWFGFEELGTAHLQVTLHVPAATLAEINTECASKLGGRIFDHFVLAVALCVICKNSLIVNRRTRKEENGTKALRECLTKFGISANGTLASQCFKVLSNAGLIRCTDPSFEIGKRCRRWVPAGSSWSLPMLKKLPDSDLSELQLASRIAFLSGKDSPDQTGGGRFYGIRSTPSSPSLQTHSQLHNQQPHTEAQQAYYPPNLSDAEAWTRRYIEDQAAKQAALPVEVDEDYDVPEIVDIFTCDFEDDFDDANAFGPAGPGEIPSGPPSETDCRSEAVAYQSPISVFANDPNAFMVTSDIRTRFWGQPLPPVPF